MDFLFIHKCANNYLKSDNLQPVRINSWDTLERKTYILVNFERQQNGQGHQVIVL